MPREWKTLLEIVAMNLQYRLYYKLLGCCKANLGLLLTSQPHCLYVNHCVLINFPPMRASKIYETVIFQY